MNRLVALAAALLLTGCGATITPQGYLAKNNIPDASVKSFPHCRGYGCHIVEKVRLNDPEWKRISKRFPAKDAASERAAIATAIADFESIVGPITHTDIAVAGTYVQPGPYQLDCIDESTNTTIYLMLLQEKGWLKFHEVKAPNTRVPFGVGVFVSHRTAVIEDRATKTQYAVDSWFHDNGTPAEIVPLRLWKQRWHPGDPVE